MSAVVQPLEAFVGVWEVDPEVRPQRNAHMVSLFRELVFEKRDGRLIERLVRTTSLTDHPDVTSMTYTLNGQPARGRTGGVDVTTTAKWRGEDLVITWRSADNSVLYRVLSLSPDRRTMTVQLSNQENPGTPDDVIVLKKKR
jgi:hypothetical protein